MDVLVITFKADGQNLYATSKQSVASNTVGYIKAEFELGINWGSFDYVKAVWANGNRKIATVLDSNGACNIPIEVLTRKDNVFVNLVGCTSSDGVLTERLTTHSCIALCVDENVPISGTETSPITASQFEQFVLNVAENADRAEAAEDGASDYATDASNYATNANNAASDASQHASNAASYATQAGEYAQSASNAKASALHSMSESYLSAQSASGSATDAGNAATAAEGYKDAVVALLAGLPALPSNDGSYLLNYDDGSTSYVAYEPVISPASGDGLYIISQSDGVLTLTELPVYDGGTE